MTPEQAIEYLKPINEEFKEMGFNRQLTTAIDTLCEYAGPLKLSLSNAYKNICNAYRDALNEMWDTNGDWLNNDMLWFDVADCVICIAEVRELVDRKVDFDTFLAWYDYDTQIHYAENLGKPVNHINLHTWLNGYPEDKKVPKEQLDKWEKEYWASLAGADNSEYDYGHDVKHNSEEV